MRLFCLFLVFTWTSQSQIRAQDILVAKVYDMATSTMLVIPSGKVCEIVSILGSVTYGGLTLSAANVPYFIPGPATLIGPAVTPAYFFYKLRDNVSTTNTTPTSAVVIPTDATGPVNVILESSTDLVTWTAANPGTYGASTTKRFFRVRAVNQ
jgi:hypothetical protein